MKENVCPFQIMDQFDEEAERWEGGEGSDQDDEGYSTEEEEEDLGGELFPQLNADGIIEIVPQEVTSTL